MLVTSSTIKDRQQRMTRACCTNTDPRGKIQLTQWTTPNVSATLYSNWFIQNKMATSRDNSIILSMIITLSTENQRNLE